MWRPIRNLFRAPSTKPPRPTRPSRPLLWSRPTVEALEERAVPASLSYATCLNGSIYSEAVDSSGDVYVTGNSTNLKTTSGAYQTTGSGAFVAKLNSTGTALIYATYLGNGTDLQDGGYSIAIDSSGDAYVIGMNTNVATTSNAIASSASGNMFIAELNPSGSGLLYSTYLPGAIGDGAVSIYNDTALAVDGSGNIYVTGAAKSGFPVTPGAYQSSYLGSSFPNAYFAEIDPNLSASSSVLYASYLGGTGSTGDAGTGIALDGSGSAYVMGYTSSSNFPATSGAFQTTLGGKVNAFVAKFNPAKSGSSSLVYSTYIGGNDKDNWLSAVPYTLQHNQPEGGIAVNSAGDVFIASSTTSRNFPTTAGAYQTSSNLKNTYAFTSDAFVTELNATGTGLIYSTYLGGGATHSGAAGIALDANGDAEVVGWTDSTTFPTMNPIQSTNGSGGNYYIENAFVTVLNPTGSELLFSTYYGGNKGSTRQGTFGYAIGLDAEGNAYVAGANTLSNFPTTSGTYQSTNGSGFILEIDPPGGPGRLPSAVSEESALTIAPATPSDNVASLPMSGTTSEASLPSSSSSLPAPSHIASGLTLDAVSIVTGLGATPTRIIPTANETSQKPADSGFVLTGSTPMPSGTASGGSLTTAATLASNAEALNPSDVDLLFALLTDLPRAQKQYGF